MEAGKIVWLEYKASNGNIIKVWMHEKVWVELQQYNNEIRGIKK